MKSRHLSILPDNSTGDSIADVNPAGAANDAGSGASYRARYQAFLNQQSQRSPRRTRPNAVIGVVGAVINFAIFVALFLAILTLFGFGLSRLSGDAKATASDVQVTSQQPASTVAESSPSPTTKKRSRNKRGSWKK